MALIDSTVIDKVEIFRDGVIYLRYSREIHDDVINELVGQRYHRIVLIPGQDVTSYPNRIQQICAVVWTPAVIEAYRAAHPPLP